jgi:hypothetical protein
MPSKKIQYCEAGVGRAAELPVPLDLDSGKARRRIYMGVEPGQKGGWWLHRLNTLRNRGHPEFSGAGTDHEMSCEHGQELATFFGIDDGIFIFFLGFHSGPGSPGRELEGWRSKERPERPERPERLESCRHPEAILNPAYLSTLCPKQLDYVEERPVAELAWPLASWVCGPYFLLLDVQTRLREIVCACRNAHAGMRKMLIAFTDFACRASSHQPRNAHLCLVVISGEKDYCSLVSEVLGLSAQDVEPQPPTNSEPIA